MNVPDEHRRELEAFPPLLRALVDAELSAGNDILEIGHSFPAPPAGAYVKLARPVSTRPRAEGGGLRFRDYNSSSYSGEFTDAKGFYFVIEAPLPPPPELDMNAIRDAVNRSSGFRPVPPVAPLPSSLPPAVESESAVARFERSMNIDYEKWHEGIGYDLDCLRQASPAERRQIEQLLTRRPPSDWRDIEALAALDSERARKALRAASQSSDSALRMAVVRFAPDLVTKPQRIRSLIRALETAEFYGGLSEALSEAESLHPPKVMAALFHGTLAREGGIAVHFAAMLTYLHGKASSRFDWDQRPFFLRFNTPSPEARREAFMELCRRIEVDPEPYLNPRRRASSKTKRAR